MSIKRISRTRVAAPFTEYVDEEPPATRIGTKEDSRVGGEDDSRFGTVQDWRAGGDVVVKASPALESSIGDTGGRGGLDQARDSSMNRAGGNVETKSSTEAEGRAEPGDGRNYPTKNRWSV